MNIREAQERDRKNIDHVYVEAFPKGEGEVVSKIALDLLSEKVVPEVFSFVAEVDGIVVGHVAFSPVELEGYDDCTAYILTPLAVHPEYQKQHIGSALVKYGIEKLSERNVNFAFVYGDPKYYCRFGFRVDIAESFNVPYTLQYPFGWLGVVLKPCEIKKYPVTIRCVSTLSDPAIW